MSEPTRRERAATAGWRGPSVARVTYGLIVVLSVLAVWTADDDPDGVHVLISVAATGTVFWMAHVYAEVIAQRIRNGRVSTPGEVREILRHEWPLVEVAVLPLLIIGVGALGAYPVDTAVDVAFYVTMAELVLVGYYSAWRSGARGLALVLLGGISFGFGIAIVLLKTLIH
jgi:hypothetical protein